MQLVYFHPIIRPFFVDGKDTEFPVLGENESGWILLQQIQNMAPGRPIGFVAAWRLAFDEIHRQMRLDNILGDGPGTSTWIAANIVKWLSMQGYQIFLKGDEFEITEIEIGNLDCVLTNTRG